MVKAKKKEEFGNTSLKSIDVESFSFAPVTSETIRLKDFSFNMINDTLINEKDNMLFIVSKIEIFTNDESKKLLAEAAIRCSYHVTGIKEALDEEEDILKNKKLIDTTRVLTNISIATSRGVLYGLLKGTHLHHAFLPLVDVSKTPMEHLNTKKSK